MIIKMDLSFFRYAHLITIIVSL
jgi:hypothetical protein